MAVKKTLKLSAYGRCERSDPIHDPLYGTVQRGSEAERYWEMEGIWRGGKKGDREGRRERERGRTRVRVNECRG